MLNGKLKGHQDLWQALVRVEKMFATMDDEVHQLHPCADTCIAMTSKLHFMIAQCLRLFLCAETASDCDSQMYWSRMLAAAAETYLTVCCCCQVVLYDLTATRLREGKQTDKQTVAAVFQVTSRNSEAQALVRGRGRGFTYGGVYGCHGVKSIWDPHLMRGIGMGRRAACSQAARGVGGLTGEEAARAHRGERGS